MLGRSFHFISAINTLHDFEFLQIPRNFGKTPLWIEAGIFLWKISCFDICPFLKHVLVFLFIDLISTPLNCKWNTFSTFELTFWSFVDGLVLDIQFLSFYIIFCFIFWKFSPLSTSFLFKYFLRWCQLQCTEKKCKLGFRNCFWIPEFLLPLF